MLDSKHYLPNKPTQPAAAKWHQESYAQSHANSTANSLVQRHSGEYGENESQVKNIFKMPFSNNQDLTRSNEEGAKVVGFGAQRHEHIGNDFDSFGTGGRKLSSASVQSKIKRI